MCHYHVWHSVGSMKILFRVGVHKYLTEYYLLCVHVFIMFCWGAFSLYALILLWQKMAVNLHAAHKKTDSRAAHKAILECFLISCITRIVTRVQCTNNSSQAVHKSWLTCSPFRVTRVFWLETQQKLKNTRVFTACKCQLRHDLYCSTNYS